MGMKQESRKSSRSAVALPTPPDGGWGWMVVLGSFFNHVIADGVAYSFGVFTGEFLREFHCTKAEVGWIGSTMIGITWGSGPIVGALINRYGCRNITVLGSLISCFSFICSIFVTNINVLYLTYGVMAGFGLGCIYLPSIVMVTYYFEKKRSFATGIAVCGSGVGTFICAPFFEVLIEAYTWKGATLIISGILLNCIVFGFLFRPLVLMKVNDDESSEATDEGIELDSEANDKSKVKIYKHRQLTDVQQNSEQFQSLQMLSNVHHSANQEHRNEVRRFGSESAIRVLSLQSSKADKTQKQEIGPLYRMDAFYGGSLQNIPAYNRNPGSFTQSMLSLPSTGREDTKQSCCSCSPEMKDALKSMTDLSLLKHPIFIMFGISNFFTSIGFCVPYLFLPDWAIEKDIPSKNAAFLISVIGIANTFGRLIFGYLADKNFVNRIVLYGMAVTICGVATILSPVFNTYALLATYSAVFGVFLGVYVSLTSVVLVDILGLDRLTNSMGLTLVFQGSAAVIGPPIAGWICDITGSYDYSFYITGVIVLISGLICFLIPIWQRFCIDQDVIELRAIDMGKRVFNANKTSDEQSSMMTDKPSIDRKLSV